MIIILFFLAQTPVEADTVKTAVGATDSLKNDSLALDTLPKYKIPEVVEIIEPVAWGPIAGYAVSDDDLFYPTRSRFHPFWSRADCYIAGAASRIEFRSPSIRTL